jgi:hypothetical protein
VGAVDELTRALVTEAVRDTMTAERTLLAGRQHQPGGSVATSTMNQPTKRGSILSAMGWMFLLEILLFWIPFVGSFIAGFVGGRKAGDGGSAVVAVFLPVIVFSILLGGLATVVSTIPLVGLFAGLGGFAFAAIHAGPLLFGAIVGGLTVDRGGT